MPRLGIHQSTDDIPQGTQGQVDLGSLLQPIPSRTSLALPFTASKIYQVQLPNPDMPAILQVRSAVQHHSLHTMHEVNRGQACCGLYAVAGLASVPSAALRHGTSAFLYSTACQDSNWTKLLCHPLCHTNRSS